MFFVFCCWLQEYMEALPATGAVVTLVRGSKILFCQGFGYTGVEGHRAAAAERAAQLHAKKEAARRAAEQRAFAAKEEAEDFIVESAASMLQGVDMSDGMAVKNALRE